MFTPPKYVPDPRHSMVTRDYSSDFALIRRLQTMSSIVDAVEMVGKPAKAIASFVGARRIERALKGIDGLDMWTYRSNRLATSIWRAKYGTPSYHKSNAIRSLAKAGAQIGVLSDYHSVLTYHDVLGVPVAGDGFDHSDVFYSPAEPAEILQRVRKAGSRWVIDADGGMHVDPLGVPRTRAVQTSAIIRRVEPFPTCRAWVLWGPPRGGKSVASRQIADAVAGGWIRVCATAALSPAVWQTVNELRPGAIILDDLDTCAGKESDLLGWLEEARAYARVIVSTMNILPRRAEAPNAPTVTVANATKAASPDHAAHNLRGAILAPGRACDEEPQHYAELDECIRAELAPSVPKDLRAPDLLAAYLIELEARQRHRGPITMADVEEMRRRMTAVGDR